MESGFPYLLAADFLLFSHVLFVAFVVLGLALILVGRLVDWTWVRNPWFRFAHLIAIEIVALAWVTFVLSSSGMGVHSLLHSFRRRCRRQLVLDSASTIQLVHYRTVTPP